VFETIFENEQSQASKKDDLNIGQNDIHLEDPFNIYDLLNKKQDNIIGGSSSDYTMKYPPGFTPTIATEVQSNAFSEAEIEGEWVPNGKKLLIISVYAPQELTEKKMLWDYLTNVIDNWNGEVVIMDDFNEVRKRAEIYGSIFNVQGADAFNLFISAAGLKEPQVSHLQLDMDFPNKLSLEQQVELENNVTREEIKRAVWDCGVDKSPGPNGFTFGSYRRYWSFMEKDVEEAIFYFFQYGTFPKGGNYSFIALILKMHDAKMVKDFRPITLIGSLYKIIAKILANRIVVVLGDIVDFKKAYDSVCWDYLDDVLKKFGFGDRWCDWIQSCLRSYRGSVIMNGSPTREFQFHKGLKQGDPLSPFLFILIMESHHILVQRVVDAGMFRGAKVGGLMSRVQSWNEIVDNLVSHLSKWKMKTLSIGVRLTLLKLVLGSMPIYHMSLFKVPMKVLQKMESIRCHFFNGIDHNGKKPIWVKWSKVFDSKEKGGLGVSSFYALNRALLFKWVWRFHTPRMSLWARVIKGIHGEDGKLGRVEGDVTFKSLYPRVYALESCKNVIVAVKMSHENVGHSLRRIPRGGVEQVQFLELLASMEGVILIDMRDRWIWSLEGSGEFSVASV
ncbi:RNA-directed DNA polymerase, eukaryota, reverse transcriptase zinc-binding domain protein, partial [Tanacetum coccineum]